MITGIDRSSASERSAWLDSGHNRFQPGPRCRQRSVRTGFVMPVPAVDPLIRRDSHTAPPSAAASPAAHARARSVSAVRSSSLLSTRQIKGHRICPAQFGGDPLGRPAGHRYGAEEPGSECCGWCPAHRPTSSSHSCTPAACGGAPTMSRSFAKMLVACLVDRNDTWFQPRSQTAAITAAVARLGLAPICGRRAPACPHSLFSSRHGRHQR